MKHLASLEQFKMSTELASEVVGGRGKGRRNRRGARKKPKEKYILLPVEEIIVCELPPEIAICEFEPEIAVCEFPPELIICEG